MVKTKSGLTKSINLFIRRLRKKIKISKVILFGSYAKGNPRPYSDIDLAVISSNFDKMSEIKAMQFLSLEAKETDVLIEPLSFPLKELNNLEKGGFLDHILKTGKIIF